MQFKWRNHDPAIGRFFNVDPLAEDYVYNSTYAFSENKVTAHIELEGLEAVPYPKPGTPAGGANYGSTSSKSTRKYDKTLVDLVKEGGKVLGALFSGNFGINITGDGPIGDDSYTRDRTDGMIVKQIDVEEIEAFDAAMGALSKELPSKPVPMKNKRGSDKETFNDKAKDTFNTEDGTQRGVDAYMNAEPETSKPKPDTVWTGGKVNLDDTTGVRTYKVEGQEGSRPWTPAEREYMIKRSKGQL